MADEWLSVLSLAGATALLAAAATDAWQEIRVGFCKLFGRGDPDRERLAERRLDEVAAKVEQADDATRDGVREAQVSAWCTRLADLLEEEPGQVAALQALIGRVEALLPHAGKTRYDDVAMGTGSVTTVNSGGVNVTNTGVMGDVDLRGEPRRFAE